MALPVRTYGDGIRIITGDYVRGQDADAASGSAGSTLNIRGGNGDGVGNAGGILINGGAAGASSGAAGGDVSIQGTNSAAAGAGAGGNVVLVPGLAQGSGTDGVVRIDSSAADSSPLLQFDNSGGTNGVVTDVLAGDQDPNAVGISALRGSLYLRNPAGVTAGSLWVNTSTTDPGTTWTDVTSGGGSAWSVVLATGATSGGTSPIISVGDSIIGVDTSGSDAGGYTIRAGNQTAGSGLITAGDLTIKGGDNASSGGPGGDLLVAGGDNTVSAATGGDLTCRAGQGNIGGAAVFAGGEGTSSSSGGDATFQAGDNTSTGRGGNAIIQGGNCVGGSGNDPGGDLSLFGGQARGSSVPGDITIQAGQPDTGGTGSITGNIIINTDITVAGTNRSTGDLEVLTGNSTALSFFGGSGDFTCGTGTANSGGVSGDISMSTGDSTDDAGDITILTGDSGDGMSGTVTIQTGNTASNDASEPAGDIIFITGNRTNAGSDANSRAGNVTFTLGTSANPNTTGPGGSFTVTAGPSSATSANGRGGSISLTAGAYSGGTASGLAGSVTITGGSSTGAAGDAGDVTITGGAPTGNSSTAGDVTIAGGAGDAAGLTSTGGSVSVSGGNGGSSGSGGGVTIAAGDAGTTNSNGGDITITAKAGSGVGADGQLALQTTRTGTDDDAVISIDTEAGSFAGSDWKHMTVGSEQASGAGTVTVLTIGGPSTNGQNLKLRVWATAQLQTTTADMMSQVIETSFVRTAGTTTPLPDHENDRRTNGAIAGGVLVSVSVSGSNILVEVTADSTESTNWMLEVDWQRGGMVA